MRFVSTLFLVLVTLLSQGQTNTFYRKYNLPGMQGGLGIVEMPDGGFVGIGQHEGNGAAGDCDVYIYKVDECGNLDWMKLIGTSRQEGGRNVILRNNGNLLVAGLYDGTGFLMELDINGNLLWEKRYNGLAWSIAIAENANNDLYVTGITSSNSEYVVMHCDAMGNVLGSYLFNGLGYLPASIICLPNNQVMVMAAYNVPNGDFSINIFNGNNGNITWSKTYGGTGFSDADHNIWGCKAILDQTGNAVMVVSQTAALGSDNIMFAKLDINNGSEIWSKVIGDNAVDQPRDVVLLDDGYAILGHSSSYNVPANVDSTVSVAMAEKDILLMKLDLQGNLVWSRTYGGEERDKGIGLRHNPDGSFLISAYTSSPFFENTDNSMDPLFIRTDSLGKVNCQVHSPTVSVQPFSLTIGSNGTSSPYSVSAFAASSIVADYVPQDSYKCLSCVTDPVFVPSDTSICVNERVYFYNTTSFGLTCFQRWALGGLELDGSLDTISYVFDTPGTYPILLYSNCGASTDTFRVNIRVHPFPQPDFTVSGNCKNDTTQFYNLTTIPTGSVASWSWQLSDNTVSTSRNPSHIYSAAGQFPVILSATSDQGCTITVNDTVVIHPLPRPRFTTENICDRDSIQITDLTSGDFPIASRTWTFSDGASYTSAAPRHVFPGPNHYLIGLNVEDSNGCEEDYFAEMDVLPLPVPEFTVTPPDCEYFSSAKFKSSSENYIDLQWLFGDGDSAITAFASHRYEEPGLYDVTLRLVSKDGCVDSLIKKVEVKDNFIIWIPNTFTPNGDNINDVFYPLVKGVKEFNMDIFDRWGKKIYVSDRLEVGWDGKVLGNQSQLEVYNYKIVVTDYCDQIHSYIGRITALR